MSDLVRQLREVGGLDPAAELCGYAADRIEQLERELAEERASREQAAAKAWEFADRIKELEMALQMIWDAYPFREEEDAELGEIVISALEKRHAK